MKYLITGLGSIGFRHLNNLVTMGIPREDIGILRREKNNPWGTNKIQKDLKKHPIFHDINKALKEKPEAVLITNPTSLHLDTALAAANAGAHLFIEKPLSHTSTNITKLEQIVKNKKLTAMVAHNHRYHPFIKEIKQWLKQNKIGKIISIRAEMSERVTDWHPWENYKISYANRQDLGGGVILTQCHEIDYIMHIFGRPLTVYTTGGSLGELGVQVEDIVESIFTFNNNIILSLHLDHLKRPPQRYLEIMGTKGRIYWNYFQGQIEFIPLTGKKEIIKELKTFERNTMYLDELKHFLSCLKNRKKTDIDLAQGKRVVEICQAMSKSLKTKKIVKI